MSYRATVLADGASPYWRLGESSGLTLVDASAGAAHPITLASATGVTYGVAGALADGTTGIALSGVTGYRGTFTPIVTGTTFSIEFFFTPNGNAGSDTYQLIIGSPGNGWLYFMDSTAVPPTGKKLNLYYATGGGDHAPGSALVDGTRYYVVLSVTAGVGQFYVNGVAAGATMIGIPSMSWDRVFAFDATEWLKASLLDEVAFYPGIALTPAQIANHYALRLATAFEPEWAAQSNKYLGVLVE